jgi:uncharacterized Zn-binding protein involved in type VI secretion
MYKKAVLDGDWTTTRGRVIAHHAADFIANSKRVAFGGSVASCGECEGTYPVIASYAGWTDNGQNMALDQDRVACPCGKNRVIGSADDTLIEDSPSGSAYGSAETHAASAFAMSPVNPSFGERFVLRESANGAPLLNLAYRLLSSSGSAIQGVTDASGRTDRIETIQAEKFTLQIKGL